MLKQNAYLCIVHTLLNRINNSKHILNYAIYRQEAYLHSNEVNCIPCTIY